MFDFIWPEFNGRLSNSCACSLSKTVPIATVKTRSATRNNVRINQRLIVTDRVIVSETLFLSVKRSDFITPSHKSEIETTEKKTISMDSVYPCRRSDFVNCTHINGIYFFLVLAEKKKKKKSESVCLKRSVTRCLQYCTVCVYSEPLFAVSVISPRGSSQWLRRSGSIVRTESVAVVLVTRTHNLRWRQVTGYPGGPWKKIL